MADYQVPVLGDFSWQPPVADKDLETAPTGGGVLKGYRYIVKANGGNWSGGSAKDIATAVQADPSEAAHWVFATPAEGWKVYVDDENLFYLYDGSNWTASHTFGGLLTVSGDVKVTQHAYFGAVQTATGDGTTTIDWGLGNKFYFTFGAANETFTFTAPDGTCNIVLVLKQDATGSRTATWPVSVMWPAGTAPTLSTGAAAVDIICFFYDGTNYFGNTSLDFSVPA